MTIKDIPVSDIYFKLYGEHYYWYGDKSFRRLIGCTAFLRERYSFSYKNNRIRMFDQRYKHRTRKFCHEAYEYISPTSMKLNYFKRMCRISEYKY